MGFDEILDLTAVVFYLTPGTYVCINLGLSGTSTSDIMSCDLTVRSLTPC